ncbi:heme exporter protein CcmB [Saccharospirillum salsuginis]|uniref:Heme exporter protein B n=1 Tax=Saccharospirillum salsuginis TaxID=418750 RepID=A0A918KTQ1_9GAMM|nr:heme exporter protein B [Saccharospirillum salsuginis]
MTMTAILARVLRRELQLAYRRRADLVNPLLFFLIVVTLFPIGVTPDLDKLAEMAAGVLWVAALLANLLSLDLLFRSDFEDGSLEQLLLASTPPTLLVLCKVIAHWLVTGLPLTLLSPVLSVMLALPAGAVPLLMLTLALGTLTLSLIGGVGAALTVGLRKGGLLLTVLIMPMFVPVIIFGTAAVQAAGDGLPWAGQLALLAAMALGALVLTPLATVAALRIAVGD